MRPGVRRAGALLAGGVAAAFGCTLLNPLSEYERGSSPASASDASDGGVVDPPTSEAGCTLHRWPPRPVTGPDTDAMTVVQAMRSLDVGSEADGGGAVMGYDLDNVCTCPEPPSCRTPSGVKTICDGDGGIDNSGGELLVSLSKLLGETSEVNERLQKGKYTLLVRLRNYNGEANDSEVVFEAFPSSGIDGKVVDGGARGIPVFDGFDQWSIEPQNVVGPPPYQARYFDSAAYVADYTLVASLDTIPLRLGNVVFQLRGSVLTGKLVKDAQGFHIDDGRVVGRVPTRSLLTALEGIQDPFLGSGSGVCGDSGFYESVVPAVCGAVDISSDSRQDNTGAPCDAVAFAARFTSSTAVLGPLYDPGPPPKPCGPDWVGSCP